jgi:predicted secreted protein
LFIEKMYLSPEGTTSSAQGASPAILHTGYTSPERAQEDIEQVPITIENSVPQSERTPIAIVVPRQKM